MSSTDDTAPGQPIQDPEYRAGQLQAIYKAFLAAGLVEGKVKDDKFLRNAVLCLKEANAITEPASHSGAGADRVGQFIEGMIARENELEEQRHALDTEGSEVTLTLGSREEAVAALEALLEGGEDEPEKD